LKGASELSTEKSKSFFARKFTDKEENPKLQIHGLIGRKLHGDDSNPKRVIHSFIKHEPIRREVQRDDKIHGLLKREPIRGMLKESSTGKIAGKARKL